MPKTARPPFAPALFLREAQSLLAPLSTAERAAQEQRYLKSALVHRGNTVPQLRTAVRAVSGQFAKPTATQLAELTHLAWSTGCYEDRALACFALERHAKTLSAADLPWLETALRNSHTWALVDELALQVVSALWFRERAACLPTLDRWAHDSDFWLRRTALLCTLGSWRMATPVGSQPFDRAQFEAWAVPLLAEREFFLRKALGWILREVAKREPSYVMDFVARYGEQLSALSRREALRGMVGTKRAAVEEEPPSSAASDES